MTRTRRGNSKKKAIMHRHILKRLTRIAECGSVGGMKWEGMRVRIKQPIASYFESHNHRREIFQTHWREDAGTWECRPSSVWPLRRNPVRHRLSVPEALGLGSSSNLTLCSPSLIFFPSLPTHPSYSPKLSPKSRLSPLNILNPLLSVSSSCIQGGAIRSWRQLRPLALGAELAENHGIFSTCCPWTATAPWAGRDQGRDPLAPGPERTRKFVKEIGIFPPPALPPSPIYAILIFIASSPSI